MDDCSWSFFARFRTPPASAGADNKREQTDSLTDMLGTSSAYDNRLTRPRANNLDGPYFIVGRRAECAQQRPRDKVPSLLSVSLLSSVVVCDTSDYQVLVATNDTFKWLHVIKIGEACDFK